MSYIISPIGPQQNAPTQRHLCVVTETYAPEVNGVALTLARLVRGLLARGHRVSVIRPQQQQTDCPTDRPTDRPNESCEPEVTLVRGLPLPGYKGLRFGLPAGRLLRANWRRHRPDVIYVATEGPLGWSAVRTAQQLGIPIISGFHTNFHIYAKHYGAGWLQRLIFRYLCSFHNRTLGTLVPSTDLRDQLQTLGVNHVSVLSRGVDSQLFNPAHRSADLRAQWGVASHDLAVLYVGRVAPEKNLGLAVKAYRAMQDVSQAMKFVIVGDGPLCTTLQKAHPDLIFCGVHTGEQLARHYASADIFLFPSETETFGNVTLEAMASELAVVAYNYAAAQMHLTHGETGVLVPFGDSQAFVDAAVQLVRDPLALHNIRRQAREYADCIDWSRVVERFETLLTSTLQQSEPTSNELIPRRGWATSAPD
ncbi:glycosyltransferase family 4 protein [Candidatus Entotheonella palauensis]|uniref:glycosyltransferase family 4 protein n=1 Tax=Candidatus Entotheonella palauensis TaxID=93172 RepID=UPI0004AFA266|nr:glycosyltransferase family 1 protein [Candidatus Entotheonella palauensis]